MKIDQIRGVHVVAMIAAFFVVVFAANAVFIALAVESFPGQVVDKPYEAGVRYNETLAARGAQEALGWSAEVERAELDGGEAAIAIRFRSASGDTLYDLDVSGELRRPANDGDDHALAFAPGEDGAYIVWAKNVGEGAWDLSARADGPGGETFRLQKRLILQ